MSEEPHLISMPCSINSNSLINFTCQVLTIPLILHLWILSRIHSNQYIYIYIYIHVYHHNNHTQIITKHLRTTKYLNRALSRSAPCSGWRVSLKRVPRPRRGLEIGTRNQRGISLRRDLFHLGEMFARSKILSGSPGRPLT